MLQQILKDMYIDPDVLEALNDEQKKTLFLKMRQEQVRRWKEREEKLEKEGGPGESKQTKPRNANSKSVSWLLGRDGDVSVRVIGDVDELTSKFINSGLGDKRSPSLQDDTQLQTILKSGTITKEVKSERQSITQETQLDAPLNPKEKLEETSTLRPLPLQEKASSPTEVKSVSQPPLSFKAPTRSNAFIVRPASANSTPGCINTRPGLGNLRPATSTPSSSSTNQLESSSAPSAKIGPCCKEPQQAQQSQAGVSKTSEMKAKDIGALDRFRRADAVDSDNLLTATAAGRGRVAHLKKTFTVDNPGVAPLRNIKPPLPTKPDHLCLTTTPTVR